ncbi:MAG TPA: hypothetical protein VFQ38_07670 [Longimicrobiales bacterium]|nr:hypothetical protein [Longimicrobiales bacterium]
MAESVFTFLFKYRPVVFGSGRLVFAAPVPLLVLAGVATAVAVGAAATYVRAGGKASGAERGVLAGVRILALALLAFCLARPTLVLSTVVPQQNYLGVLLDDSRSMRIADGGAAPRSAFARGAMGPEGVIGRELARRFRVRYFRFSSGTDRIGGPEELAFDGERTRVAQALDRARSELGSLPLAGLVLVSDGADNAAGALSESLLALRAANVPVYAVGVGREALDRDIEIARVATPTAVLKGARLAVELLVTQRGYAGETVKLFVEDEGRVVASQDVKLGSDGEPVPVSVRFTAEQAGPRRFRFRIPPRPGERVAENNVQDALVRVRDDREKILYFEGEPRFELKFIRRAAAEDKNLQIVTLLRTAENKFLRLDVDSAAELSTGFPRTRDELFGYRGLVLGGVEAGFFTHDQLQMIADFVGDRGGGLLMLGSRRTFAEGGYGGTPLADALPVVLDDARRRDTTFFAEIKVAPTRAGAGYGVTQIAGDEAASRDRWRMLPAVTTVNRVDRVKPGATILLSGAGEGVGGGQVVLAYQRYGRGSAFALPIEDSWLWQMSADVPLEDQSHETFWRQLLRWLVSDVPTPVAVRLGGDRASPGEPVSITAEVSDERYVRLNNARVTATVTAPNGAATQVPLEWAVDRDGEYRGSFTPAAQGVYAVTATASQGGPERTSPPAYLSAAPSTAEYFDAAQRAPLLRRIAAETGGRYYTEASAGALPEDIALSGRGATVTEERELWDMPIVLLLFVGLVGAEWGVRRGRGLA